MGLFHSNKEKHLWFLALLVVAVIFSSLFLGLPFLELLANQNIQAALFVAGMLLTAILIIYDGTRNKAGNKLFGVYLGLVAVYLMLFLRLGLAERSHLIEYSVLAIFVFRALTERYKNNSKPLKSALLAFLITCIIGGIDEMLQLFLPNRVFDTEDIIFNCFAALAAISSSLFLRWARKKFKKT
ncbi:VanZ family protein [Lutimonas sp.]|uniref:VanZ family protein n=1 Tax=Lutimonas sp. TaxID=1872403 RepID=UPI003D9AC744